MSPTVNGIWRSDVAERANDETEIRCNEKESL